MYSMSTILAMETLVGLMLLTMLLGFCYTCTALPFVLLWLCCRSRHPRGYSQSYLLDPPYPSHLGRMGY